ncbi:uncharacterized protein LOC128672646 [Plodia interpunctella]|uniref:uncharacterized protein LOC128672646 n=1 Tax=Plodia interpunctella TaxID=58824 RepID=UPI002368DECD|nr:uncharacterized protein LOC128672646 [Plodia interpunctella]
MGKRKRSKDPEEIRRKIRRLERRLNQYDYSDSEDSRHTSDYSFSMKEMRSAVTIPNDQELYEDVNGYEFSQEPITQVREEDDAPKFVTQTPAKGEPVLPVDILEALGVSKDKVESFAPKIREEISERWGSIIKDGLSKESIQKLMDSILIPENFKLLKAPQLNIEISGVLSESARNRDKRLEKAQNHLGKGIAAITNLLCSLIEGEMDKATIIKKLSEAGQLFLDLHCQNTYSRRKLIFFSLDKKFSEFIQGVKRDSYLFGEDLGERIKAKKTAEKSGIQVKRVFEPRPSTSNHKPGSSPRRQGNWHGPPRTQAHRGRGGGPRNHASSQSSRRPQATREPYSHTSRRDNASKNKTTRKN